MEQRSNMKESDHWKEVGINGRILKTDLKQNGRV
jgi:hypothetical protein